MTLGFSLDLGSLQRALQTVSDTIDSSASGKVSILNAKKLFAFSFKFLS